MKIEIDIHPLTFEKAKRMADDCGLDVHGLLGEACRAGRKVISAGNPDEVFVGHVTDAQREFVAKNMGQLTSVQLANETRLTRSVVMQIKRQERENIVRKNWQTMHDGELKELLGYTSVGATARFRDSLGLKRKMGRQACIFPFTPQQAEEMLTDGGKTLQDLARMVIPKITRERMRQKAMEWKIKSTWKDRSVKWYAARHNCPDLGDKEKVIALLTKYGSVGKVAAALSVVEQWLRRIVINHQIDPRNIHRRHIELKCFVCGNPFNKYLSMYNRAIKKGQTHFYCSRDCSVSVNGKEFGFGCKKSKVV